MKVLYDHQIFEHQRIGGVSRYFSEVIKHLPQDVDADVSIQYTFNEHLRGLSIPFIWKNHLLSHDNFFPNFNFKGKKRLSNYAGRYFPSIYPDLIRINKEETIKKLRKGDFDIFHPTFFDDYFLDHIGNKPYVLTVHDMIIELYPEFINSPVFVERKRKLVDLAAHVIAVSENTKRDLIHVFDTPEDKISVTYHASSLVENDSRLAALPNKYLLYVGDRRLGYKNFAFFISSIQPVLADNKDLFVVCTGDEFNESERYFLKTLGLESQVKRFFVEDTQLYNLYKSAEMFVYPSYYEGFGIPILEAFQAGCPVVLSDGSCFPEVVGDSAVLFGSKSPDELRNSVLKVLNDRSFRDEIIKKGYERLKNFSWDKTSKQTVDIYRKVIAKNR